MLNCCPDSERIVTSLLEIPYSEFSDLVLDLDFTRTSCSPHAPFHVLETRTQHKTVPQGCSSSSTHWSGINTSAVAQATFFAHQTDILVADPTSHDSRAIPRSLIHLP